MKVSELIELLEQEDQDMEVVFSYDYGDYWHTEVAAEIEDVGVVNVEWNERLSMNKVLCEEDGTTEDEMDDAVEVVVLR